MIAAALLLRSAVTAIALASPLMTDTRGAAAPAAEGEPAPGLDPYRDRFSVPVPETPKWFSAELGFGAATPFGNLVQEIYGDRGLHPMWHGRFGLLLFSVFDLGLSADFAQITGRRIGVLEGERSAEYSRLTLAPFTATAIARLDLLPHQPVVPYAGAGVGYLVWSERNPIEDEQVDGDKYGWTWLAGAQILLDELEPARADDLDGWWGVNDTYLTLEYSRVDYNRLGKGRDGLNLNHWVVRASFLFEY